MPAGACDLAEISQINVFYAVLSLEVNQEVTSIHLTTHCFFSVHLVQLKKDLSNDILLCECCAVCQWAVTLAHSNQPA